MKGTLTWSARNLADTLKINSRDAEQVITQVKFLELQMDDFGVIRYWGFTGLDPRHA